MARPVKEFSEKDWHTLNVACQYKISLKDAASILDCSDRTLERRIREKYDCSFVEYRQQKMARTRLNLFSKQVEVAMGGNVAMLIFLGKNYLDQTDRREVEFGKDTQKTFKLAYSLDEEEDES